MKVSEEKTTAENWKEFIPHREDVLLEDLDIFKKYYVISERENGLNKIKIVRWRIKKATTCPLRMKPIRRR